MKHSKIWLITGAAEGLGQAAVKYLLSNGQQVIALTSDNQKMDLPFSYHTEAFHAIHIDISKPEIGKRLLFDLGTNLGPIDIVINNFSYSLIDKLLRSNTVEEIEVKKEEVMQHTLTLIHLILPFMKPGTAGHIVSLPPKPCLEKITDTYLRENLVKALDNFFFDLNQRLNMLTKKITVIQPGERLNSLCL